MNKYERALKKYGKKDLVERIKNNFRRIKGEKYLGMECTVSTLKVASTSGYSHIRLIVDDRSLAFPIHRLVWSLHNNDSLKNNDVVFHKCKNKACISPKHLGKRTRSENALKQNLSKKKSSK